MRCPGAALVAGADRVAQHHQVPAQSGQPAGAGSRAFHRAREAHHSQAPVGFVALGDAGFFRHRQLCGGGRRNLHPRPAALPGRRTRPALPVRGAAPARGQDRQRGHPPAHPRQAAAGDVRQLQRAHVPGRVRRWPRAAAQLHRGLVSRRHHPPRHGHALHGLCRRHLRAAGVLQRAVRRAVPRAAAGHRPRPRRGHALAPGRRHQQPVGRRGAGAAERAGQRPAGAGADLGGQAPARPR